MILAMATASAYEAVPRRAIPGFSSLTTGTASISVWESREIMRSSNIGGQAVLEGIMMRNGGKYSVAVRKPDGEIESEVWDYHSVIPWKVLLKIPFIRGIFNFVDSLVLGMKTLMYSASFFEEEDTGGNHRKPSLPL